jgi:hypothetical protein
LPVVPRRYASYDVSFLVIWVIPFPTAVLSDYVGLSPTIYRRRFGQLNAADGRAPT